MDTPEKVVTTSDLQALGQTIAEGISEGMRKNVPQKVTFGQYMKRPTTLHPKGPAGPQLAREYFQNGFRLQYDTLSDTQIDLLNKLDRSGRYIDRRVEVIYRPEGGDESVEIRWKCRTPDDRSELKGLARDFTDILTQIVAAQDEEDLEVATAPPRRHFGDSRAYRDAKARAEAH